MTDLLSEDAPDAEDFLVCAMSVVMRAATERGTGAEFPFCLVTRITGGDDPECGTDDPVMQVEFYDLGAAAASIAKSRGHRRMTRLARDLVDVTMSDGSTANADYVTTTLKPVRMPYADDKIVRYVGRYKLGFSFVATS